jgi:DNA polymerase-3 subunit delta'
MLFEDIPGLDKEKKSLARTVLSDHVAHAQLFMGKPGSANLAMALAYATMINCEQPKENDACGTCPSCLKNKKYIHPDLHFAFPVSSARGKTGKDVVSDTFIEDWRYFLHQNPYGGPMEWSATYGGEDKQLNISKEESRNILKALSLKAFEGNYKIMLVWLAEYLHPSAANALLKILEEPPKNTLFLIVTNDYEQLLSTILSRTQIINIPSFKDDDVAGYLLEKYEIEKDKARQLAHISGGDLNEAIHLVEETEDDSHDFFREWMRLCWSGNLGGIVKKADEYHALRKISQKNIFQYGLNILRESLAQNYLETDIQRLFGKEQEFLDNFAKVLGFEVITKLSNEFNSAAYHLERNANTKILFTDTSLLISKIFSELKSEVKN